MHTHVSIGWNGNEQVNECVNKSMEINQWFLQTYLCKHKYNVEVNMYASVIIQYAFG